MLKRENQAEYLATGPAEQLRRLLGAIAGDVPLHMACVYSYYPHQGRLDGVADFAAEPLPPGIASRVRRALEEQAALGAEVRLLYPDDLPDTGFASGLLLPLVWAGDLIGLVALLSRAQAQFSLDDANRISLWASMAQTIIENKHLREKQAAASAIHAAARIIGEQPSVQDLVTILHKHLCGPHVAMCLMLFYGPVQEDRPNGPFDYLEVQGSWLRRYGAAVGLGVRFYLDQYADLLSELDARQTVTISNIRPLVQRLDPLVRAFLRAERIQSMTLIGLHAGQRRLGVIAIATDKPYQFPFWEMENFRVVSEFLAVGTMARVLKQQHDLVQRARSAMLDAVTDGVMMVLPHPLNASVLAVNACFTRMFQISPAAAQGLPLAALLDRIQIPDDAKQELRRRWLNSPVSDTAQQRGEFAMMHPDGYPATIAWTSAPVHHQDRVMGRIFIFHDVSPERASAALRANFMSWVSHELRTPLTSIRGFAEFILEATGDDLPDLAREYTEIIHESAIHLNRVFNDILEIARADVGQLRLRMEDAHLPDIIIYTVALLELEYKNRGQRVVMELDDNLPHVRADVNRLTQVISNLLVNAIKYAPSNSEIRFTTRYVTAWDDLPPCAPPDVVLPGILVTVADEGPGIAPDEAEKIFLPFFRSQDARAGKIPGTGLGLTIARSIIELHRGKIWAGERQRGQRGARLYFTLPVVGL